MKKPDINLILYLISLLIMGSHGIVAHFIPLNSIEIVFLRTVIGSIVLIIVSIVHREKYLCLKDRHDVLFLFLSGLALGAGWIFLFEGYRTAGVSISTTLYYLGPMIAMLLSPIFFKEKLTKEKNLGAIIVLIGVLLLNPNYSGDPSKVFGVFCGFMSGILYAVMVLFNKRIKNATGIENTTCQLVSSFFLVTIFLLLTSGIHIKITGVTWIPVLWIGIINTGVSCFFYYSTIPKLPISTIAIFSYLDPVSAVIFSTIILGERLQLLQILGIIFIIGGVAFSQLYPLLHTKKLN